MKKETIYILGGVALVGVAYYLYNKNKPATITIQAHSFANLVGSTDFRVVGTAEKSNIRCGGCPPNSECMEVQFPNGNYGYRCVDMKAGKIVK